MKSDVGPLPPCPYTKTGRHEIMALIPGSDEGDLTLCCQVCGSLRRVNATGHIGVPLDEMSGADIDRVVSGLYGPE